MCIASLLVMTLLKQSQVQPADDMAYLHQVAHEVIDASKVLPDASIPNGGKNTTGFTVRVPGETQTFYPAFWMRDAAMMLGADLVPGKEVMGWVKVIAATQPGPGGLSFAHGLTIPGYSIPDHIALGGEACWFPGAYADQGVGAYGFLPPADDAFMFIQMVFEVSRLEGKRSLLEKIKTPWGVQPLITVCERAFDSVAVDPQTELVVCDAAPGKTRVDWGFCDSIRKTGSCLMPSLLRWQAASRMSRCFDSLGDETKARHYRGIAHSIATHIEQAFFMPIGKDEGRLLSATGLGRKDDVWASAFAVWLRALSPKTEECVARHLLRMSREEGIIQDGQVRGIPPTGEFGGSWEDAQSSPQTYQNGGYWATPTGWMVVALRRVDRTAGDRLLHEYVEFVRKNRDAGAPFEWVNSQIGARSNPNYGTSAGLVYAAIARPGH